MSKDIERVEPTLTAERRTELEKKDAEIERLTATLTEARRLLRVALDYLEEVRAEEPYQPKWLNFAVAMMVLRDFVLIEANDDQGH